MSAAFAYTQLVRSSTTFKAFGGIIRTGCTMAQARSHKLSTGAQMPSVGLGTWKISKDIAANIVYEAIRCGYRHIDCASDYGNEKEVGKGIKRALDERILTRDELFVTSKLWNTYHKRQNVKPALLKTLADLQLDYVDLYMVHFPISLKYVPIEKRYPPEWLYDPSDPENAKLVLEDAPLVHTWAAMEDVKEEALCKHIGICNFTVSLLMDLMTYATIKPAVLQVEMHPYLQQPRLFEYCKRVGLPITASSPLGSSSYIEIDMDDGCGIGALKEPVVTKIAQELHKTPAQIVLRWAVQRGIAIIPKTNNVERLSENITLFDFQLSDEHMESIASLDRGLRFNDPGAFCVGMGMSLPIYD